MKKKGFTLIELLGVIVILGIIATFILPSVLDVFTKSESDITEAEKKMVIAGAKEYITDNSDDYPSNNGRTYCLTVAELVDMGYVQVSRDNLLNNYVNVSYNGDKFTYEVSDKCKGPVYLINQVKSLVNTSNENWIFKDDYGNIRYRGANPNNYVTFNDETWRIIGIVDGYVKVIRNESIGNLAWGHGGGWKNSWLIRLLNPIEDIDEYDNSDDITYKNSLYWNSEKGICRGNEQNDIGFKQIDCDFVNNGLFNVINMIQKMKWYFGKSNMYMTSKQTYESERGIDVFGDYTDIENEWQGHVGLMSPSDYGYASSSSCSSNNKFVDYHETGCANIDWLYIGFEGLQQWLITSHDNGYVDFIGPFGIMAENRFASISEIVRPVVHLKKSVIISNPDTADGSKDHPYEISL